MGRSHWSSRVFQPPGPDDGRTRDIFPLPTLRVEEQVNKRLCRAVSRRIQHRAEIAKRTNRVIAALNSIFFGRRAGQMAQSVRSLEELPLNQRLAVSNILQCVKKLGHPPLHVLGSEALQGLRAASSTYGFQEAGVGDVVPLDLAQLSLPEERVAGVDLLGALHVLYMMWLRTLRITCCRMLMSGLSCLATLSPCSPTTTPV